MRTTGRIIGIIAILLLPGLPSARAQVVRAARQDVTKQEVFETAPITAALLVNGRRQDVQLVGRTKTGLVVLQAKGGEWEKSVIQLYDVQAGTFDLALDRFALREAMNYGKWATAVQLLHTAVYPAFRYLDLPENNAVDLVSELGVLMLRAADIERDTAETPEAREALAKRYTDAYQVFQLAAAVEWYPKAALAGARSLKCLADVGDLEKARESLKTAPVPAPGDPGYGLYWLVRGKLALDGDDIAGAMAASINAVAFDSRSLETFPEALLLTGICYERLENAYRARDVYIEVASIFPGTRWSADACSRLRGVMKSGTTEAPEAMPIERVFFGAKEDMNALARTVLSAELDLLQSGR